MISFARADRDREADPDGAARAAGRDLRVDADHLAARVDQRAAGVAGVDRRVGLDDVVDLEVVGCADLTLQRGDDARGDRAAVTERVPDRNDRIADAQLGRVAQRQRHQLRRVVGVDLQHGEVTGQVAAHDLRLHQRALLGEADAHLARVLDDMRVGEDVTVLVEHEARPGGDAAALVREAEGRLLLGANVGLDVDDPRAVAVVDVRDRQRIVVLARVHDWPRERRLADHLACGVAGVDDVGGDQDRSEQQDDQATEDSRQQMRSARRPFHEGQCRSGPSTTSKRDRRQRRECRQPDPQAPPTRERTSEIAPRGGVRRLSAARAEAALAQHPRVARGRRAASSLEARLELAQREPRRDRLARPREHARERCDIGVLVAGAAALQPGSNAGDEEEGHRDERERSERQPRRDTRVARLTIPCQVPARLGGAGRVADVLRLAGGCRSSGCRRGVGARLRVGRSDRGRRVERHPADPREPDLHP